MSLEIVAQAEELNRRGKFDRSFELLSRELPGVAERFDGSPAERERAAALMADAARELCKGRAVGRAVEALRREVEKKCGRKVCIERDKAFKGIASLQKASLHRRDYHRIAWNGDAEPWHPITAQLEILSFWADAEKAGRAVVLLDSPRGFHEFRTELDADVKKLFRHVDFGTVPHVLRDLYRGVTNLVWNVPQILFAEAKLYHERPELRASQFLGMLEFVEMHARDARGGDRAALIPAKVTSVSRTVNLVTAAQLLALFGVDRTMAFNARVSELRKADELYARFREADAAFRPGAEFDLVSAFADALAVRKWIVSGSESEYVVEGGVEEEKEEPKQDEAVRASIRRFLRDRLRKPDAFTLVSLYMLGAAEELVKRSPPEVHALAERLAAQDRKGVSLDSVYRYTVEGVDHEMSGYETFSWLYAAHAIAAPERLPALELPFEKAWERTVAMFRQRNPGKRL